MGTGKQIGTDCIITGFIGVSFVESSYPLGTISLLLLGTGNDTDDDAAAAAAALLALRVIPSLFRVVEGATGALGAVFCMHGTFSSLVRLLACRFLCVLLSPLGLIIH
jgi:hypothetical protein